MAMRSESARPVANSQTMPSPVPSSLSSPVSSPPPSLDVRAIVTAHGAFVWRTLRRLGVGAADVEDVAQEVFLVVHRRLAGYDARSGMRAWLYGICARKASEHRRKAWVRREQPGATAPEANAAPEQVETMNRRAAREQLEIILAELDPKKRDVFVLFELEEMSLAEVAVSVGCPLQTAYSRLQSARELVRASIDLLQARERLR
jgi:RNA polymerase sigma-70 factor (ECF subfamily)